MIQRSLKRGDVRQFDDSYNKGFKNIWASEVDADFNTLYDALAAGQTVAIPIGSDPPKAPAPGQLWFRGDPDANLYVFFDDGSSSQWVPAISSVPNAGVDSWILDLPNVLKPVDTTVDTLKADGWTLGPNGFVNPSGPSLTASELTFGAGTEKARLRWLTGGNAGGVELSYNRKDDDTADDPAQPMWFEGLELDSFQINRRASQAATWEQYLRIDNKGQLTLTADAAQTWTGITQGQPGTGKARWSTSTTAGSAEASLSVNRNPINGNKDNAADAAWQLLMSNATDSVVLNHIPRGSTTQSTVLSVYANGLTVAPDQAPVWSIIGVDGGYGQARITTGSSVGGIPVGCEGRFSINWNNLTGTQDITARSSWILSLRPESDIATFQHVLAGGGSASTLWSLSTQRMTLFGISPNVNPTFLLTVPGTLSQARVQYYQPTLTALMSVNMVGGGSSAQDDTNQPSWGVFVSAAQDSFSVTRFPAGSTNATTLLTVTPTYIQVPSAIQTLGSGTAPSILLNAPTTAKGRLWYDSTKLATIMSANLNTSGVRDDTGYNGWQVVANASADSFQILQTTAFSTNAILTITPSATRATFISTMDVVAQNYLSNGFTAGVRYQNVGVIKADNYGYGVAFGWNGSAVMCRVENNAPLQVTTTSPSDKRYKLDVREDVQGLDLVRRLRPVSFLYDQSARPLGFPPGRQLGLIAQEAQEVVPTVVTSDMCIEYEKLVPILIRAIQELANGHS